MISIKSSFLISSILVTLVAFNYNRDVDAQSTYTGAIVEYSPIAFTFPLNVSKELASQYMLMNVQQYILFIDQAVKEKTQIIVFPEYGITGNNLMNRDRALSFLEEIPSPKSSNSPIIPCGNTQFDDRVVLQTLSCAAIKYNTVVVVNMGDVQPCNNTDPNCPTDNRYQYNTQVAFGSEGAIIGRYHKSHLYGEQPVFDQPITPDIEYFTTDFNVTFGMMICFDIMFEEPRTTLVALGINNFVYSTEWVNANYAYATQIQQALSYEANANVLAANIGTMAMISGSGIYTSGTPQATYVNPTYESKSQMLIATLPKDPSDSALVESLLAKQQQLQQQQQQPFYSKPLLGHQEPQKIVKHKINYQGVPPNSFNSTFTIFKPSSNQEQISLQAVNNGFVCSLTYSTGEIVGDQYFSVVSFNGNSNGFWNSQICMVVVCLDNSEDGCSALIFNSSTPFTELTLSAPFSNGYHVNPMVSSDNTLSNYYPSYNSNTNTFAITNIDPVISVAMFATQWDNSSSSSSSSSTSETDSPMKNSFLLSS
ncbi:hypothetical protein PPL_07742 [Heterostelium album PN500]|uniref:CN hydrolase domain-containing protein n=1 Tax=Heterostelium pallidum (strain ATCC 26659 / Pp 5 / PN500) TaxID=670386 RepID=D3BGU0_HETP5|nr:hypothetical protein PPL_07742 [Heterostelium album PN500]EFA79324.1 hypothetical protein PPL_07742 [Heterostelium album PN500]|eukprot:XP_020431445.1 hypothetical protein PPL_07742 [Heterostelium album PN500]